MAMLIYRIPKVFFFFLHQNSNKNTAEHFSKTKILAIYFIHQTNEQKIRGKNALLLLLLLLLFARIIQNYQFTGQWKKQLQGCLKHNFIPTTFVGEKMCPLKAHVTLAPPLMLYIFTHCHLFVKLQTVLG